LDIKLREKKWVWPVEDTTKKKKKQQPRNKGMKVLEENV